MRVIFGLILTTILLCASGCAVGNTYNFENAEVAVPPRGQGPIGVAVHDRRPQITGEGVPPNAVGVQRAGFGNPWRVTTASGDPLAAAMSRSIARALADAGYSPSVVPVGWDQKPEQVIASAAAKGKSIVVTVGAFWSDTYNNVTLTYDITIRVIDSSGAVLSEVSEKRDAELGGSFWDPPKHAKKAVPAEYGRILGTLLARPEIQRALAVPVGASAPADVATPPPAKDPAPVAPGA